MPAKPAELNLKNIADHLLQFPRPATMVANMSALFGQDQADNKQEEPAAEQTLAWYMALAYAMGARSLTEEEEQLHQQEKSQQQQSSTSSSVSQQQQQQHVHVLAKKRRDKRLFSFWVPMLCCKFSFLIVYV